MEKQCKDCAYCSGSKVIYSREELVICNRFPRQQLKERVEWCGEWKPREGIEDIVGAIERPRKRQRRPIKTGG